MNEPIAEKKEIIEIIRLALDEDIGEGDVTTEALVKGDVRVEAGIIARERSIVAGISVAARVFKEVESKLSCKPLKDDGDKVSEDETVLTVSGPASAILTAERTALNFLQRMSGIATMAGQFAEQVADFNTIILDTRKTTPALRLLEKYASSCGGAHNHRMGLHDCFLIKDNHRALWAKGAGKLDLASAIRAARAYKPGIPIEIEVETEDELRSALEAAPDWALLDNMSLPLMKRCVSICAGRCKTEASGGIGLKNARQVAATGVDAISLGCLTHSARAVDFSLEITAFDKTCDAPQKDSGQQ